MDGKVMDVVGSTEGSQRPQEIVDIVEAIVNGVVGMANSWTGLDALDSVPRTDLTPGWNTQPGTFDDHFLLVDEVMPAKSQTDNGEGGCSISLSSNGEPTMLKAPTS
ncbi:hypothetical protein R1flu_027820 [Riccia fluitans]|uniref:Uncharacterized protein n=1 Tax=Riccia fluitans TaxID=41844 RepID=A0ABD1XJX0_9MARC